MPDSNRPPEASAPDDPSSWVDQHGDYLYNFACSRLNDTTVAQDIVQETFLAALKAKDSFTGASSRRTWLTGILKHKIIDHLRCAAREQAELENEPLPIEQNPPFNQGGQWAGHWQFDRGPKSWGIDPAQACEDKEFRAIFHHCLEQLPARMSAAFTLSVMEQQSTDEVCKELSLTATNLWTILSRTRQQLRHCLETYWIQGRKRPQERTRE